MDLNKLAQELGGKPVTDLDSLASELGGQVASTPGGYGAGTFGKDVGKLVGAGAVKGIAGAPETVQAAGSAAARDTLFAPTEVLNLVADPRRLANKLIGSVGLPPIFETTKEKPLVPAEITEKQRAAVDETLARGKIPQLRQLTEFGNKISEDIENTISPEMRLAMAESQPTGNIIKALETGDFSDVSMGKNPTALGLTGQAVKVFGSSAPQFIVAMVTKTPTLGAAVGFGQAGAEGIDEARNYVKSMSDEQLAQKSEYFRNLIALGYSTNQAREMTEDKAADTAALAQGTVGALGGAFTSKLIQGGFDKALIGSAKSRLGQIVQGVSKGTLVAGAEGALTEMAEGVATDLSIDKTIVREIGVDSFANLVLGAIGEAAPGAVRGALAKGEKVKGAEAPEVPPTPAVTPVTPVTPAAGAPSAVVGESDFEAEEAPPPAPPAVTPVTPPPVPPAGPEAVAPVTPPPDTQEEGPLKGLTPAEVAIQRLKPEFQEEYFSLRDEGRQIIAKQKELADQGEDEDASLSIRLEEILSRVDELNNDRQYRKPIFTKSPNDPAIEKEALALADELEKAGDAVTSDGLRTNLSNLGGYTDPKKLDYYKGKLLEAQQKAGKAPEMPKETFSTRNFIGDYKADKARFDKFLPTAPQQVQNTIAKSDQYIQALVDKINAAGYKVSDINPTASNELQKLKKKISEIGGTSFRYLLDAQHVARNNRYANPKKVTKDEQDLAEDFAEADRLLGAAPTPAKPAESTELEDYARNTRTDDDRYSLKDIQEAVEKSKKNKKDLLVSMEDFTEKNPERMIPIAEKNGFISINKGGNILAAETAADVERNKNNYNNNPDSYDNQKARALANLKDKEGSITEIKESRGISKEYAEKVYNHFLNYHAKKFDYLRDGEYELWDKLNKEHNDFMARLNAVSKRTKETKKSQAEINQQRQAEKKAKAVEEKKPEIKEVHIEGKKSEPITSKTIEEAIDKADDKVDAKKIKQSIKNQFDQAIKRAKLMTEKDWADAKGLSDIDAYVTISIPGDGKFKVKNNKERLEEVQKKLTAAVPLKEGKPKREVSAVSVSSAEAAFKAMVDDKDMENAIEYAKLQNFDINKAKLNPTQKATVDSYLKNPAEFERQQEEAKSMEDAKTTALRADQEKRARERIEADEKREEEARFKAVIDTTVRSTEAQLKRDIADRKISTKDARRMVEAFPSYPEGVVKPYTIRLIEKRAGVEPSFNKLKKNITETGQRLSHPLVKDLVFSDSYEMLDLRNPRTYIDKAGKPHRTFEKNGVRVAFTFGETLFQPEGEESRAPQTAIGDEKDVHFRALLVDPEIRRQGKATTALKAITYFADRDANQLTLYLEPAELEKNGITKEQLTNLYSKFQFKPTNESGKIMVREPESVQDAMKRVNAEMKAKGIEPEYARLVRESKELDEALAKLKQKELTEPGAKPVKAEVKDEAVATIRKDLVRFASGMSALKDLISGSYWRAGHQNYGVGFDVGLLSKNAIDQMAHYVVNLDTQVFVDSGAFSHFRKLLKGKDVKDLDFDKILAKYDSITEAIANENEAEKQDYPRPMLVMPDIVGDQKASLDLIEKYKDWIAVENDGNISQPIIPLQKGELTLSEAYDQILKTLKSSDKISNKYNEKNLIFGIPSNAEAVSRDELTEFLKTSKPARIHFLGAAADSKLNPLLDIVAETSPGTKVTADASKVRSAILNGVAKGKTRDEAIKDALFEAEDPMVLMYRFGPNSDIIDVIATEVNPEQIKLLTNQTSKLSAEETSKLEEHYGLKSGTDEFFKLLREDIVKYVNKGADAVDAAIRSIIAKLQAGLLSVAVVFNPATFQTPDFNIPRFIEETKTITAVVPQKAEMSDIANKAYSVTAPAFIKANQAFFIADKPNGKIHLFDTDGKFLKSSDALYGKQAGDVLTAEARVMPIEKMQDIDKITPAGVFNLSVSKSPDYTGGYTLRFTDDKGDMGGVAIHAVYTGDVKENREAKLASKDPKDKKVSFGCINVDTSFFTGNIIPRIDKMENAGVVVIPDAQEQLDLFVKPTTEKVAAPAKEIKTAERTKIVGRETPYYNDFTNNIDYNELYKRAEVNREDRIKEYAQTRAATRRITKKVAKYGSDIPMQRELNELLDKEEMLKVAVSINKPKRDSAADFMAKATKEMANENLAPEVEAVIRQVYKKYPSILEGLRLSLRTRQEGGSGAGNFNPYTRIVTLWKDSSGVENASTIRHELTHSLEQIMTPEARQAVVEAWARSFENVIKRNTDKKSQEFFNKVFDFLDSPSKESFDAATNVMPSYDYYQYMNPSEYWAVNAEKLMAAKLGSPWARFVSAVKKLLEALKSVFGVNNTYAVHKEFDNLINGKIERTKNEEMLIDYLLKGKVKLDFLENIDDIRNLLEKHNRPKPPTKPSLTVRDAFMGGYDNAKNTVRKIQEQPLMAASNMVGKADRALTYQRNKNIFYGTGLEQADRERYGGKVRNAHQQAIASVALVNAIHSGHVATQVMTQGKLIFNQATQMFQAAKDKFSMANVVRAKAELIKRIGNVDYANGLIQGYFEAKRSRSIINEYLDRTAAYENAKAAGIKGDDLAELKKELNNIEIAMQKINMTDEAIDDFINEEKTNPELREMMDNWTAVNQNMIDMMEFSGMISKQRAKTLRNIKDYVPWYRIMDDQVDVHAPSNRPSRGQTNVGREQKFKAGEVDRGIDDIVDNMIHNVLTLTRNSMRNYAANRIVMEYGTRKENGKLKVFPNEEPSPEGVRFNILAAGRRIVVEIKDPLVAESVIGMENIDIPMNGALAFMANTLRRSITTFPAFQVVQLFMDAPTAALVTGLKRPDKVWAGVFSSFLKNLRKDDPIVATLRSYGIGGYQSSARTPEKEIQMDIGLIEGSWFAKAMKGLDRFGDASDYAQRRSVYLQTLKETGDELLAVFQANNVIDFQKRGSGQIAQLLTRQVAFMNAYAQSIDVLAKGITGGGLKGLSRSQAFARMITTGMLLSSATIVYCMLVGDDDEYNKLDDQTKMRNIYIPGLDMRLPMHTGASFFFKAVPELIYNAIMKDGTKDEYDKKRLTRALSKAAADSLLGPNITPSGVKPVIEITLNKNFFTGGQVTPKGMEDLAAFRQYNQNTSELGKIISSLTGTEKTRLLNPMEADHLMRGLLGTAGAAAMWGSNMLIGNRPEPQAKDNPFYGQFIMPDVPRGREDLYYDLKTKTDEAYKTHQDLLKKGRKEEAQQWFKDNKELIQVYGYTSSIETGLKELNGEIRRIGDQPENKMGSKQKRDRINELQEIKTRILKDVISMRKRAGLDESYL